MNDRRDGDGAKRSAEGAAGLDAALASLGSGSLVARLARDESDIAAAQALRYRVFYDEMKAKPDAEMERLRRDVDPFDNVCEHLLVCDTDRGEGPETIIATYRLLRGERAREFGRFYTAGEYDIAPLLDYSGEILELGRSCVDQKYRARPTMQLLWAAIAQFVFHYDISMMFGCASLHGVEPESLALPLSYLHHFHLAPEVMRPVALPELHVGMDFLPEDQIDKKAALTALPPLLKGYLRLGGFVGDGAVVDHQFNTTDVCIVVKTDLVTEKYYKHYGRERDTESEEAGGGA
ncbi:MAG: GNAT family N-acetyltransferase [Rhodospirillaceae bacterium]|jgi:putative hemolysin|nr:GNAT family N-acetyltransferase [Rhodospirillaceae bacterium]MBT5769759.1 GNAT family N-acetyltransferase [Rhodospirillaceae bacterium]MBT6310151.1 GNAT family N-acetyltransferase [Rhodospirillaceae bacterium]